MGHLAQRQPHILRDSASALPQDEAFVYGSPLSFNRNDRSVYSGLPYGTHVAETGWHWARSGVTITGSFAHAHPHHKC